MRKITEIIIHCAATSPGMDIGAAEIRDWHVKDNGWAAIGYHCVIRRDGTLESGRPMDQPGVHCTGHNARSIGICLVGGIQDGKGGDANQDGVIAEFENGKKGVPEANYTPAQWATLEHVVRDLLVRFPGATLHGHREFAAKACPCFDVREWALGLGL
jgi:N-acetyl-anhydromuramyl-L-alanine amidase AmpD